MKSISSLELQERLKDGKNVHIIDVREDFEVAQGKIPEAKHISLGEIPNSIGKLDKHKHYYMVCQGGGRSASACEFLSSQGYDVTNVAGGMSAWQGEIE